MNLEHMWSRLTRLHFVWLIPFACGAVLLALAIDLPTQRFVQSVHAPLFVRDLLTVMETFGNGFGVAGVMLVVAILDKPRRIAIARIAAGALGAGLIANVVKAMACRVRPHSCDLDSMTWLDTFMPGVALLERGPSLQSFPSAHTATAFGLAMVMLWLYPHGRRLFVGLALGVAAQRLAVGAHFPSDLLIGMAIGIVWGHVCVSGRIVGGWFSWLENRSGMPTTATQKVERPQLLQDAA